MSSNHDNEEIEENMDVYSDEDLLTAVLLDGEELLEGKEGEYKSGEFGNSTRKPSTQRGYSKARKHYQDFLKAESIDEQSMLNAEGVQTK